MSKGLAAQVGGATMRKFHFNVYVPVTDDNPTARSEVELVLQQAMPEGAEVIYVETFDDKDGRLIAAAPTLLAALKAIVAYDTPLPAGLLPQAQAAIAKATGETSNG